ncbi:hypothetical protein BKA65DRAFT_477496 [Rhexocercosporidium sp. MPI-PUGE-AT-0058]|nr:hypothetical protein BKA65DRAFT_477496 [Rhexocercosporidium sp. MPI-PUGE-AT-0058]
MHIINLLLVSVALVLAAPAPAPAPPVNSTLPYSVDIEYGREYTDAEIEALFANATTTSVLAARNDAEDSTHPIFGPRQERLVLNQKGDPVTIGVATVFDCPRLAGKQVSMRVQVQMGAPFVSSTKVFSIWTWKENVQRFIGGSVKEYDRDDAVVTSVGEHRFCSVVQSEGFTCSYQFRATFAAQYIPESLRITGHGVAAPTMNEVCQDGNSCLDYPAKTCTLVSWTGV